MKKIILYILFCTVLFANNNGEISTEFSNKALKNYNKIIDDLKNGNIKENLNTDTIKNSLIVKMNVNKEHGYMLAYKRDDIKLKDIEIKESFNELLNNIYQYRIESRTKDEFIKLIDSYRDLIKDIPYKTINGDGKVVEEYNNAIKEYKKDYQMIISKIEFIKSNLDQLIVKHYNIHDLVNHINKISGMDILNSYLYRINNHISIGSITISLFLLIIVYFAKFVILPIVVNFFNKFNVSDNTKELNIRLYNSLRIPVAFLTMIIYLSLISIVFEVDISTYLTIAYWGVALWLLNNFIDDMIELYSGVALEKYPEMRKEVILFFKRIVAIISITILISITLSSLGVELTALLGGVGVLGLGASLAFKDTFSNFIGSVNVIFDKTFSVGDWIEVNDKEGTVIEIGMRQTRLRGFANNEYSIPNAIVANSIVNNWSKRKIGRRIKFKVGITYETPIEKIELIKDKIYEMLKNHEGISNRNIPLLSKRKSALIRKEDDFGVKNTLLVFIDELNDYSIDILVYAFSRTVVWEEWLEVKESVIVNIIKIVEDVGAEFAYPTQVVNLSKE